MTDAIIIDYINHIGEHEFFDELFLHNDHDVIAQGVLELLLKDDKQIISNTLLFIQDGILLPKKEGIKRAMENIVFNPAIIVRIEALTQHFCFFTRHQAVYTLGKIGNTQSIPLLHHVFQTRKDSDPLLLPRLIGEIFWLEDKKSWHLLSLLAQSSMYPTRWSTLSVLSFYSGDDFQQVKRTILELLKQDVNVHIRDEAEYLWQEFLFEQTRSMMTQSEKRALRKRIEKSKPSITFSDIEAWFTNTFSQDQVIDYTVEQLIGFIETEAPHFAFERGEYQRYHRQSHT